MISKGQLPRRAGRASSAVPVFARNAGRPGGGRGSAGSRGSGGQQGRGGGGRSSGPAPAPRELLTPIQYAPQWWTKIFTNLPLGPVESIQLPSGRAARPGHSTAGRAIQVLTNHVPLAVSGLRVVHQYDVRITRVAGSSSSGPSASPSDSPDAAAATSAGGGGGGGGKGGGGGGGRGAAGRGRKEAKVVGPEAHAVLSRLLDGGVGGGGVAAAAADAQGGGEDAAAGGGAGGGSGGAKAEAGSWVFDGSQALYSVDGELRRRAAAAATAAAAAAAAAAGGDGEAGGAGGGGSGGGGQLTLQLAASPDTGVVGGTYKVDLKLVGAMDVAQCLKEAARPPPPAAPPADGDEEAQPPAGGADDAGARPPPPVTTSTGSSTASPRAAALAVLDLVTRAGVAWAADSVRTGAGAYVSYKQEDAAGPVKGQLPLKLLRGFRSAVAQVAAGTTLTIDAASAVVAGDGPLLAQLQAALAPGRTVSELGPELSRNARRLEEALAGLEVQPSYTANRYKLSGKFGKSARDLSFKLEGGRSVTVEAYFKERYGVTLRHPGLPCVLDKKGGALPLELLSVVKYQKRMSRLDARQKADYIRTAALKPQDRLRAMREALSRQLGSVKGQVARAFGLTLQQPDFLKVPAQLLPGPLLQVARLQAVEPGNKGEWAGGGVAVAPAWRSGAVLCYLDQGEGQGPLRQLLTSLDKALAAASAAPLPPDLPVIWASVPKPGLAPDKAAADAEFWLRRAADAAAKKYGGAAAQMVMVVLPSKGGQGLYDSIKAAGDGRMGLATQCINPVKAGLAGAKASDGPSFSYTTQLALSVNAKLGGATTRPAGRPKDWLPLLGERRLMVLGADISRGAAAALAGRGSGGTDQQLAAAEADSEAQVSAGVEYAAVVGSADSHAVDYRVQLSAQVAGNRDIVVGMRESVRRLLLQYGRPAGAAAATATATADTAATAASPRPASELPEVLLMYRDGLSESQFDTALAVEFEAIVQACADVGGPGYRPRISFVVVQKSHNTRFFPTSPEFTHKSGNVLPGTAVDRGVTDPVAFDFFLNSHAGIQGTNRAPRYTALVDEVGFTSEALQLLTNTLCHTYPACTRALSLPPPVRYADRAADRARALRHTVARPSGKQLQQQLQAGGLGWFEMLPPLAHAGHVV